MWKAFPKIPVSICVLLLSTMTLFVSPGWRHTHHGGEEPHTHGGSDSHSPGHSHSRGGHNHHHHHAVAAGGTAGQNIVNRSHVHVTFLWFHFTLPDFSDRQQAAPDSKPAAPPGQPHSNGLDGQLVEVQCPWTFCQFIHVALLWDVPLPDRVRLSHENSSSVHIYLWKHHRGRLPDAPATPPPQVS